MIENRFSALLHRGLQALVMLFALTQMASPLLHAHYAEGGEGATGLHLHMVNVNHLRREDGAARSEIRDPEARAVSAPVEYFRDESLRLLDLPFAPGSPLSSLDRERFVASAVFTPVPATAAQPFPKPLPHAPPA